MVNALEPGQLNINGWFQRVADRVGHQETYGVPGGAMSFFQNIFRGGGQAVTGPEDTAPQSESSTASNAANSSEDKAVEQGKKRGRPPGKLNKKTE